METPNVTLRIKKLDARALIPTLADIDAAGLDLCTLADVTIPPGERALIGTGIAMAIPTAMVGLIWPRSKLSAKFGIDVLAGVVDSSYRGEIMVALLNTSDEAVKLKANDKIAQMVIQQQYSWLPIQVVDELEDTARGLEGINSQNMRMQ